MEDFSEGFLLEVDVEPSTAKEATTTIFGVKHGILTWL